MKNVFIDKNIIEEIERTGAIIAITKDSNYIDLTNIHKDIFTIEFIAHHLARINRYNGATYFPYTVAEHCIRLTYKVPHELRLAALLHDAEETVVGDITYPIAKYIDRNIPGFIDKWRELKASIRRIIYEKHNVNQSPYAVDQQDFEYRKTEMNIYFKKDRLPLSFTQAEQLFIKRYNELKTI